MNKVYHYNQHHGFLMCITLQLNYEVSFPKLSFFFNCTVCICTDLLYLEIKVQSMDKIITDLGIRLSAVESTLLDLNYYSDRHILSTPSPCYFLHRDLSQLPPFHQSTTDLSTLPHCAGDSRILGVSHTCTHTSVSLTHIAKTHWRHWPQARRCGRMRSRWFII